MDMNMDMNQRTKKIMTTIMAGFWRPVVLQLARTQSVHTLSFCRGYARCASSTMGVCRPRRPCADVLHIKYSRPVPRRQRRLPTGDADLFHAMWPRFFLFLLYACVICMQAMWISPNGAHETTQGRVISTRPTECAAISR